VDGKQVFVPLTNGQEPPADLPIYVLTASGPKPVKLPSPRPQPNINPRAGML